MRIKIVPDAEPDTEGQWTDIGDVFVSPNARGWLAVEAAIVASGKVPSEHHIVAYDPGGIEIEKSSF